MKNVKLFFVALLVILVASSSAFVLLAFSSNKGENELVVYSTWEQVEAENFEKVLDLFTKKTGIKVVHNSIPGEELKTVIVTKIAGGNPPDLVVTTYISWLRWLAEKNILLDVTDLIEPMENQFIGTSFVDAAKYESRIYAGPFKAWIKPGFYYNVNLFKKLGLKEPRTWDELLNICDKLKIAGIEPIASGGKASWNLADFMEGIILRVGGPQLHYNLTYHKIAWTDPKVKEAFKLIADLTKRGYFGSDPLAEDWTFQITRLGRGEIGMFNMGNWLNLMMLKDFPEFEWKKDYNVFPFPVIYPEIPIALVTGGDWVAIFKDIKNTEEAKMLLKWLAGSEAQEFMVKSGGWVATNKNVSINAYHPADRTAVEFSIKYEIVQDLDHNTPPEFTTLLRKKLQELWTQPDRWEDILTEIEAEAKRIF